MIPLKLDPLTASKSKIPPCVAAVEDEHIVSGPGT